jgi:hypothetical protein
VVHQKDGVSVKSKISRRNKRWWRGEIKKIVAQQKKGSAVKFKVLCWI